MLGFHGEEETGRPDRARMIRHGRVREVEAAVVGRGGRGDEVWVFEDGVGPEDELAAVVCKDLRFFGGSERSDVGHGLRGRGGCITRGVAGGLTALCGDDAFGRGMVRCGAGGGEVFGRIRQEGGRGCAAVNVVFGEIHSWPTPATVFEVVAEEHEILNDPDLSCFGVAGSQNNSSRHRSPQWREHRCCAVNWKWNCVD